MKDKAAGEFGVELARLRKRISELKRELAQYSQEVRRLRDSEELLRVLLEYAPEAYYLCDLKGTFVDGNRVIEQLTGYV